MATSILSILAVILTIVGPAVAAILLHRWEDRQKQRTRRAMAAAVRGMRADG